MSGVYYLWNPNLFIREDPCGAEREGVGVTSRQEREDDANEQEQEDYCSYHSLTTHADETSRLIAVCLSAGSFSKLVNI